MYTEADIDAAVAAGALTPDGAAGLRRHVAGGSSSPAVDEEHFRLLTGFNDIFVAIAAVLLLSALSWIGGSTFYERGGPPSSLGPVLVAAASWGLAEFFTKRRRMALPSIVLLLAFVGSVFATCALTVAQIVPEERFNDNESLVALVVGGSAAAAALGAWLHWRRFRVPITVAAGAVALVGSVIGLGLSAVSEPEALLLPLLFAGGVALFALAMWWDMSDRERLTRRSDVAFWLHLAAAPMIAHSVFNGLGVFDGGIDAGTAFGVIALYILFACLALAIDRRALLVSSLVYVLYAMRALFAEFGAIELNVALTGLVIGSALLMLSAFWHPIRRAVVGGLPEGTRRFVPVLERSTLQTA
ncbi:MAG TPA: hypothetical protein VEZ48_08915 [Sphingomonadaceae bacterium]|nr:hypothetical protein [Sphingomonadaceae bacterium]